MAHGTTHSLVLAVSVLVAGFPVWSAQRCGEVPFELSQRHLIIVKGGIDRLNGLNLLIDTGSIPSVVDAGIARKLRLQAEPSVLVAFGKEVRVQSAVVDEFSVGSVRSGPVPVGISDLSYLRGTRIDAIVGLDVLARNSFSIDYKTRVVNFGPQGRESAAVPLEIVWPFVTVLMNIAGEQLRLLVDTGSGDLVLFKSPRVLAAISGAPWSGDKTVQYASGVARLRGLYLRQVRLGPNHWEQLTGWMLEREPRGYPPGIDGVLGVVALNCQRVRFDFERSEFGWTQ
jgi:hypothetical protein